MFVVSKSGLIVHVRKKLRLRWRTQVLMVMNRMMNAGAVKNLLKRFVLAALAICC